MLSVGPEDNLNRLMKDYPYLKSLKNFSVREV